ncbi:CheR family methyltransferase [Vibrio hannami]|uniref:CheR family methyltransferase n=1 Tax=Vibrio hannami TaxID=2717094 RepID=UPI00240F9E8A|nr:CheR family methyltransferase [Vibrio hannami]MDG3087921.1 CheR family methyltransferase [Vibrio hannami]
MRLSEHDFKQINKILELNTGIVLSSQKKDLALNRLISRVKALGCQSFHEYLVKVGSVEGGAELSVFIDRLTTHETYFFRESEQFEFLKEYFLKSKNRHYPIKAWCAACSTGEEVYSLGMVLDDLFQPGNWGVTGTDVSETAVTLAKQGHYAISTASKIPKPYRMSYCLKGVGERHGSFIICKSIRRFCQFYADNLLDLNVIVTNFDIIFLRNVLIYFSETKQQQILDNVISRLNKGGLLFVGHSEGLRKKRIDIEAVAPCVYRKVTK